MIAFLYAIGALVTVAFFGSRMWFTPQEAFLLVGGAVAAPTLVIAYLMRESMRDLERVLVALGLIIAVAAGAAYKLPSTRAAVVKEMDDPRQLLEASEDPAESVVIAACRTLVSTDHPKRDLVHFLQSHAPIAGPCLAGAENREVLVASLAKSLGQELQTRGDDAECTRSLTLGSLANDAADGPVVSALVECTMATRSIASGRECCGQTLASLNQPADVVASLVAASDNLAFKNSMRGLLALNFEEPEILATHRRYARTAGLIDDQLKTPFVLSSCDAYLAGDGEHLHSTLKWVLNSESACMTADVAEIGFDLQDACQTLVEETEGKIDQRICKAAKKAKEIRIARETTSPERNAELGRMAGMIAVGSDQQRGEANLQGFIESATTGRGAGLNAYTDDDLGRIKEDILAHTKKAPSRESLKKGIAESKEKMEKLRDHPQLGKALSGKLSEAEMDELREEGKKLDEKMKDQKPPR